MTEANPPFHTFQQDVKG